MTPQEVFDTVVNHLRSQGKKAQDSNGNCKYRTPEGLRCAAGCLILDEEYNPHQEGKRFDQLLRYCTEYESEALAKRLDEHRQLIADLQECHDSTEVEEWETQLALVAKNHSLVYLPPSSVAG